MTVSILLIGVIMCVYGMVYPYKNTMQNVQDLILLLNLQGLFVLSCYNDIGVTLLFSFAFLQFLLTLLNHVRLNCYGRFSGLVHTAMTKISVDVGRNCFNCRNTEKKEIQEIIGDNHCMEFREPLIGEFDT